MVHDFSLRAAQTDIITVSARRTISEYLNPTTLRTIDVTVEGIPRDQTGKLKTHGEKVSLMISTIDGLLGSANKEEAKITAPGMACKITSNKANKFIQEQGFICTIIEQHNNLNNATTKKTSEVQM